MVKTNEAGPRGAQGTEGVNGDGRDSQVPAPLQAGDQRLVAANALALSWQLALVVIVPIVGGYLLDQHYHKMPILTLCGLGVAMIGVFGVLSRLALESGHDAVNKPEDKA